MRESPDWQGDMLLPLVSHEDLWVGKDSPFPYAGRDCSEVSAFCVRSLLCFVDSGLVLLRVDV